MRRGEGAAPSGSAVAVESDADTDGERRVGSHFDAPVSPRRVRAALASAAPIIVLLVAAAALFAIGVHRELPYVYHPDEATNINRVRSMHTHGTLNPGNFSYPSGSMYLQWGVQQLYEWWGHPVHVSVQSMGNGLALNEAMVVSGRVLSVVAGVVTVALSYWIGARMTRRRAVGLICGAAVALSPFIVEHAAYITPDIYATAAATAAVGAALVVLARGTWAAYLAAGALAGLAGGMKYNAAVVALAIAAAHILRGDMLSRVGRLAAAGAASIVAFLVTTPYALLDSGSFGDGLAFEIDHYRAGHPGAEGGAAAFYLERLWSAHGPLILLVTVSPFVLRKQRKELGVLLAFVVPYLVLVSAQFVRFERQVLPVVPTLVVVAVTTAFGVVGIALRGSRPRAIASLFVVALLAWPATLVVRNALDVNDDGRAPARTWLAGLPPGTRIGLDAYTPWVDGRVFETASVRPLLEPAVELDRRFDLVVVSEEHFGRFFAEPERYGPEIRSYEVLFDRFPVVARFVEPDGDEILVLDT